MKHPFENQGNRPAWEDLTTRELDDLLAAYRALAEELPELRQQALELEMARKMAGQNLV